LIPEQAGPGSGAWQLMIDADFAKVGRDMDEILATG